MVTRQRSDLLMNIPALRKLDAMLIVSTNSSFLCKRLENLELLLMKLYDEQAYLDNFGNQNEFWYVSKDADESGEAPRNKDKWWLPTVKVSPDGLSDITRKWLVFQKDSVSQILKAAMAINAQVLSEMEIPESYIESLPKVMKDPPH